MNEIGAIADFYFHVYSCAIDTPMINAISSFYKRFLPLAIGIMGMTLIKSVFIYKKAT